MNKVWMDIENRFTGSDAIKYLYTSNDIRYWDKEYGITKVDPGRWRDAQKQELEYWFMHYKTVTNKYYDYKNITKSLPANLGKTIEIGCGPYPQFSYFNKKVSSITLLDPLLENYVQLPLCPFAGGKLHDYASELLCDSAETLMKYEEYDTVLCIACLEHVSNADMVLDNLVKITKPGGVIILMERLFDGITPNIYYDKRRPLKLYKKKIVEWSKQLDIIKETYAKSLYQYDIELTNMESIVGVYKKPKYPR